MKIFLSFLPIIIAACVIGFGAILIIDDEIGIQNLLKRKIYN